MVWQQALYLVNLLCKFVPCDYNFPPPDTSLSEPQAFKDLITLGFDEKDRDNPGGGSLRIGGGAEGWGGIKQEFDYTENDPLVVITKTGKLRGYWMRVVGGRKIRAFEGIPYAEPPTGYFRFSEPSPKIPWSGLHWANKKGPKCLQFSQIELKRIVGSEDCLCLNVYAPKVHPPPISSFPKSGQNTGGMEKYPVMIFIHGGGFQIGAGNDYGPSYLLQQDLILVTFNYRVGVFGFMSTGDKASPGNYGLKDQAIAIQWVYENIEVFNGDPARITLVGQEAGGASVHLQMLSGRARPFFQAGISMSGSAFNPWVFCSKEAAHTLAKYYAKKFSCPVHNSEAIVSCLRRVDAADLAKTQIQFLDDLPIPLYLFRPVLEDLDQKEVPFITQTPEELYRQNLVARFPWVAGFTEDEGLTFLLPSVFRGTIKHLRSHWNQLAPDFLDYQNLRGVDVEDVTKKINWLYFKQKTPLTATIKTFSDAISLRFTVSGVHKALQAHSTLAPTYGYMFSYNGKYNLATLAGIKPHEWGVGQGEDLFYLLNSTHFYQGFLKSDHEMLLAKIMVNLFGNFAAKRYPTFTMENREDFQIWNPITDPRNMSFLLIHKKIRMIPEPYLKQSVYWESIGLPDTVPYINTTEHYKDYHFITATQPPSTRVLSPSQQFSPNHNTFYTNGNQVVGNLGYGGTRDIFNLRANLSLRQISSSAKIRAKENEIKVSEEGVEQVVQDVEKENPELGGKMRNKYQDSVIDDPDLLKTIPTTTSTTIPPSKSPPIAQFDEDLLFLPPWNPYGVVGIGLGSATPSPSPSDTEDISTTPISTTGFSLQTERDNDDTNSHPTTPHPLEEKIPNQDELPSSTTGPLDLVENGEPGLSHFTGNELEDNMNGHQYPSTTTTTISPPLPNSLDLLDDLSLNQVVDVNHPPTEDASDDPTTPGTLLETNGDSADPQSDIGPEGVEEAEGERIHLKFKQDSYPSIYEDEEQEPPTTTGDTSPTTTTPSSTTTPTTSTSTPPPRVMYPSRYHSPYVSPEIRDDAPYNIMK